MAGPNAGFTPRATVVTSASRPGRRVRANSASRAEYNTA